MLQVMMMTMMTMIVMMVVYRCQLVLSALETDTFVAVSKFSFVC